MSPARAVLWWLVFSVAVVLFVGLVLWANVAFFHFCCEQGGGGS